MANLYLVDKPAGGVALGLAKADKGAKVVLLQDGVYLEVSEARAKGVEVYAVKRDVELRGLGGRLPGFIKVIDYDKLVELLLAHKVVNFA